MPPDTYKPSSVQELESPEDFEFLRPGDIVRVKAIGFTAQITPSHGMLVSTDSKHSTIVLIRMIGGGSILILRLEKEDIKITDKAIDFDPSKAVYAVALGFKEEDRSYGKYFYELLGYGRTAVNAP